MQNVCQCLPSVCYYCSWFPKTLARSHKYTIGSKVKELNDDFQFVTAYFMMLHLFTSGLGTGGVRGNDHSGPNKEE